MDLRMSMVPDDGGAFIGSHIFYLCSSEPIKFIYAPVSKGTPEGTDL